MRSIFRTRPSRVLARVTLYGGLVFVGLPFTFSQVMVHPHRRAVSARPAPGYEQLRLASDGLRLRAWLGRGDPGRACFVIAHGLGDDLESYLGHARPLRARGHSVLLLDLRGHGGSEGSFTTLGGLESHDVAAAMRWLREAGLARSGVGLMGASMGAVAVLLAAADQPDVRVVVAEAPYDTYRDAVRRHAGLVYRMPPWLPLIPLSIRLAEWRAGFSADEIDCVAAARRIRAPLLAVVDGADERMPEPVVRRVVEAHPGAHRLWVAPGAPHVGAILDPHWEPVVIGFLEQQGL